MSAGFAAVSGSGKGVQELSRAVVGGADGAEGRLFLQEQRFVRSESFGKALSKRRNS